MAASRSPVRDADVLAEIARLGTSGLGNAVLLRRIVQALRPAIPFDAFCATTTDPTTNLITDTVTERESASAARGDAITTNYFARVYFEHDLRDTLAMLRGGLMVRRLSDATAGDLARSGRYRLHLQPRHLGPEVYVTFIDRGLWGELHLTREVGSPDFSDRELELLRQVSARAGAGLKSAALRGAAQEQDAPDTPGVLILDRRGRVVSTTANVAGFLRELGRRGADVKNVADLPVVMQVVLAALARSVAPVTDYDRVLVPRLGVRAGSGRWLTLHAALADPTEFRPAERVVVITPSRPREVAWLGLAAYDLSPREEEIVKAVVIGQSTRQIADRLFIAEHTVQRHLSNIFAKVGVRGRRALVKRLFVEQMLPGITNPIED